MPENIVSQWINYMETVLKDGDSKNNKALLLKDSRANAPSTRAYPTRCYLEITNQCNLRCAMCGQSWFEGKRTYIPDEVLQKFRELYPYLEEVCVFGFGESLVDKRFFQILADIPSHIRKKYVSNGVLIDQATAEKMIELQLHELYISMDAATEDTYYFVRGQKVFTRIIQNIQGLMKLKKERNVQFPEVALSYTFYRRNLEEFLQYLELAHSLGIEKVTGDYLIVYREELVQESLFFDQERTNKMFKVFRQKAKELNLELNIPPAFDEAQKDEKSGTLIPCYEPWEFVYFRSDGMIQPCCVNDKTLGDINTQSFKDVWNGEQYQKFRKMVNSSRKDPNCAQCMGRGMRKVTEKEFHIKILDKEGKVIGV
jgi:radical SAM protein with 4Fe4S-binding SPASM domain